MNYFYNFRSTGFWYQYFKKSCKQTVTLKGQSLKTIFFFKFHQLLDYERRIHASRTIFEPNLKWAEYLRTGQFCNAVEHEPVETRVLNPTASKASYKPKQRSNRKTKQTFFFLNIFSKMFTISFFLYLQIHMEDRQSAE